MSIQELLAQIRPILIQRVSHALARGAGVRETFEQQLTRFYDLFEQAVMTGDPAWLEPVLIDWVNAPTQSELQGQNSVSTLLNQMIALTNEVARESLSEGEALDLLDALLPFYTFGLEKTTRLEMEARVTYVSNKLVEMQQKLERLDRSKSSFIAVAAHELKTPLTLIEGYAAMMRDIVAKAGDSQIDSLFSGVITGISRLRQIVDDMIDVSLIDNKLLSLNFQPVWLSQILGLLQKELEASVKERRQKLQVRAFPGSEQWIYADGERIYQALYNVLTNAIKFTPDKGKIIVDGRTLPGFIEITVTDSGIGISPEDQTLIFEKFGQLGRAELHSSGKTKFKGGGPGLGLPITRGIIEAHGGTMWVESDGYDEKAYPGSTFHILLPLRTEATDPKIAKLFSKLEKAEPEAHVEKNPSANDAST